MLFRNLSLSVPAAMALLCLATGCDVVPRETAKPAHTRERPESRASIQIPIKLYCPSRADEEFLDELEHRIFNYFWEGIYPETGIAIDHTENRIGKVAATGFELGAICIGVERGWITYEQGYERAALILNSFYDDPDDPDDAYADGQFGLFWHFIDGKTGRFKPIDCVAMCDSADFIAGAIIASQYFKGTEVAELARKIYDQVEWDQFVARKANGGPGLLSFGWVPLHTSKGYYETDGLLNFNMSGFADNSLLIYALALGSDTHPIPRETWEEYVNTYTMGEYSGYECLLVSQLFCRQVPHSFIRFSRKRDRHTDYFLDIVNALLADRVFNMRENDYPPQVWGLNDCFGEHSYTHGAPPGPTENDGTVATCSFAGALPHVPELSLEAMRFAMENYKNKIWGKYGFTSSINLRTGYASPLYVGIELGPMMLLIENYRTGLIWDLMMADPVMRNFIRRAEMSGVVDDFELPVEAPPYAAWTIDGGYLAVTRENPRHGQKCLEIRAQEDSIRLTGRLTENDLLDFHYDKYLSLWVRDMTPTRCAVTLNGRNILLERAGAVPDTSWTHYYYRMPVNIADSSLSTMIIDAEITGPRPALDNLSLEAVANLAAPEQIRDLRASTGRLGGCINLKWTTPVDRDSEQIVTYMVKAVEKSAEAGTTVIELDALQPTGETENRSILLKPGLTYYITISAMDQLGHCAPFCMPVIVRANPTALSPLAYDFEDLSLDGWHWAKENCAVSIVETENSGHALRVNFNKNDAWNNLTAGIDPEMVALHRYLTIRVKGKVELLGKLWCSDALQQDMEAFTSDSANEWTTFRFDTKKATLISPNRDPVRRLYLFFQPGNRHGAGTFFLDDLEYSN